MDVCFNDYVTIMALYNLYMFENKKSISIETLNTFRDAMIDYIERAFNNKEIVYSFKDINKWLEHAKNEKIDKHFLNDFIIEYAEYFYLEDDRVSIFADITCNEIAQLLNETQQKEELSDLNVFFCGTVEDNKNFRDILKISSIEDIIKKYKDIEKKIEDSYNKLYTVEDNKKLRVLIKAYLVLRYMFLMQLESVPEYQVDAFRLVAAAYMSENSSEKYDKYPIDLELWSKLSDYPEGYLNDMDAQVYDIYQYAIFGKDNNKLYLNKLQIDLDNYYMKEYGIDLIDDGLDYDEDDDPYIEALEGENYWLFYANYLNNLNKFMDIYGSSEDLLRAKRRLIYALDEPESRLYEDADLSGELDKNIDIMFCEDTFYFIVEEMNFMAEELFRVPYDEYTIRKLLLVSTYYNLTRSDKILEIVNSYSNHPRYKLFYDIIINNCEITDSKEFKEQVQKLTLKKPNE